MYYVTLQHGGAFPHEIERLWCTVATVKRNVIPILEFLISRGLQEMNAQASLAFVLHSMQHPLQKTRQIRQFIIVCFCKFTRW